MGGTSEQEMLLPRLLLAPELLLGLAVQVDSAGAAEVLELQVEREASAVSVAFCSIGRSELCLT